LKSKVNTLIFIDCIDSIMFSNKKSSLPPRPHLLKHEHMMEDLENAVVDDVAFKIISKYLYQYLLNLNYINMLDFLIYKDHPV